MVEKLNRCILYTIIGRNKVFTKEYWKKLKEDPAAYKKYCKNISKSTSKAMKKYVIDLRGKKFGRWKVIKRKGWRWKCKCTCGTVRLVNGDSLRRGVSSSCGCLQREWATQLAKIHLTTHGLTGTRLHGI